jgi:hydroxylamine dehydrogenase
MVGAISVARLTRLVIGVGLALLIAWFVMLALPRETAAQAPDSGCTSCHVTATPGVVLQWQDSRHYDVDVTCESCHVALADDPSGYAHNGFTVTAVPSPKYCQSCHADETEQYWRSKHAWASFMGPLKPYYTAAREAGLDPFSQETARELNPEKMAKRTLSPLFPDSGALAKAGLLNDPDYNHNNVVLGCIECHGSFVIAEPDGKLSGWPNVGTGRINPDGTLGSCSSCHTRHKFSIAEARKPSTCGQCHLGPDHPQYEIYEESKHGNIYEADGEHWNWDAASGEWGPDDITAPTCATCHMSGFGGVVETTHDAGARLYWELQPKVSVPQWKGPDEVDMVLERVPDLAQAEAGRAEMRQVCRQCHSSQWTDNYFIEFDKVVSDYNRIWEYTDGLLQQAYAEELISRDNPLDEVPETMHYYVWHHDGRRWRMGASMMAPDWTHWNGAVDALLDKLTTMENSIEQTRTIKELQAASTGNDSGLVIGMTVVAALALLGTGYVIFRRRSG